MHLCVEIAKQASISFSIPPPHAHTHRLELQEAKVCGSPSLRYWQHASVLIRASRCAGWQGRPESEQADGIRVTAVAFQAPKLPLAKGLHLNRAEPGNLLKLGSHLSLAHSGLILSIIPIPVFFPHSPEN